MLVTHEAPQPQVPEQMSVPGRIEAAIANLEVADVMPGNLRDFIVRTAIKTNNNDGEPIQGLPGLTGLASEITTGGLLGKDRFIGFDHERIGSDKHGFYVQTPIRESASNYPYLRGDWKPEDEVNLAGVHFLPKGKRRLREQEHLDGERYKAKSVEDKRKVMIDGMEGVVTYLTLVEAGLITKPDILVGHSNTNMARIAERLGLKRISTWKRENGQYGAPQEGDNTTVYNTYETFRDTTAEFFRDRYQDLRRQQKEHTSKRTGKSILHLFR